MNNSFEKSGYKRKIINTIKQYLSKIKNPQILEFGVRKGISTSYFLELCNKNNGKLFSIDVDDYSELFEDDNWTFIQSRDDNIDYIDEFIPNSIDVLHIDSLHEAKHVSKLIYLYYAKIKPGGFILIDDVSCLPYVKGMKKDSFGNEIANQETFDIIQEIYASNTENFDLEFSFLDSGLAIIQKLNSNQLLPKKKIKFRKMSLLNKLRKIYKIFSN